MLDNCWKKQTLKFAIGKDAPCNEKSQFIMEDKRLSNGRKGHKLDDYGYKLNTGNGLEGSGWDGNK